MKRRLPFWLTGIVILGGCDGSLTELVISVNTDYSVPSELNRIRIVVSRDTAAPLFDQVVALDESDAPDLPLTLSLTPATSSASAFDVTAIGMLETTTIVERYASTTFAYGKRKLLVLDLTRACEAVSCAAEQTCVQGTCEDASIDPDQLPDFTGEVPSAIDGGADDSGTLDAGDASDDAGAGDAGEDAGDPPPCDPTMQAICMCATDNQCVGSPCIGGRCAPGPFNAHIMGDDHVCSLFANDTGPQCYGGNGSGQLGNGGFVPSPTYFDVMGISTATSLAAGPAHNCAVENAGVKCWGENDQGQLGDGTVTNRPSPALSLVGGTRVCTGFDHTCAIHADGLYCWGGNARGQLGQGDLDNRLTPVRVTTFDSLTLLDVACGAAFTCAMVDDGSVYCWGSNLIGQLGTGSSMSEDPTPAVLTSLPSIAEIEAGQDHACARSTSGEVYCWGDGVAGQLGDEMSGSAHQSDVPVAWVGVTDLTVQRLALGYRHTCVDGTDGSSQRQLYCFGDNTFNQITSSSESIITTPTNVASAIDEAWVDADTTCYSVDGMLTCIGN